MEDAPQKKQVTNRKCNNCEGGTLVYSQTMQAGVGTEKLYKCASCDVEVRIPPEGFIGTYLVVWAIVSVGLIWLFLLNGSYPGVLSYVFVGGFVAIGGYSVIGDLIKHLTHPILDQGHEAAQSMDDAQPKASFMTRFWDLGLIKTPVIAILLIALVLLVATLIGYANYTYF
jgi:hypothetical protein